MDKRYVKGIGMTRFTFDDRPSHILAYNSIQKALKDADMKNTDIDAAIISTVDSKHNGESQRHYQCIVSSLLNRKIPILRIPAVCGGGGVAFWNALRLKFNNILVVATDKVSSNTSPKVTEEIMNAAERVFEQHEGINFPVENALVAQEHMLKYGTTPDDLALIAHKNHENAYLNPNAHFYKKKVSLESIKSSPVVTSPLRLMDCSISVSGAVATIISNDKTDIEVKGSGLSTDYLAPFEREDLSTWRAIQNSSKTAFEMSKMDTSDINFAELHDAFTILELIQYEDLGFAKKGDGGKLIRDGITKLDGKFPVNTSGGLKARGHPISPTGLAQIYEIVEQIRGNAGDRQVKKNNTGLTCNIGGAGGSISTHIFKKVVS